MARHPVEIETLIKNQICEEFPNLAATVYPEELVALNAAKAEMRKKAIKVALSRVGIVAGDFIRSMLEREEDLELLGIESEAAKLAKEVTKFTELLLKVLAEQG